MLNLNNLPSSGSKMTMEALEEGGYAARVVNITDLGVHYPQTFDQATNQFITDTSKRPTNFVWINYELSDEFMKDEDGNDIEDKPRWFGEKLALYPPSIDQAKCTKRGKNINPQGYKDGDLSAWIGKACTVMLRTTASGKNRVADITGAPRVKGYQQPELVNPSFLFSMNEPDMEIFEKIPDWLKNEMKASINYKDTKLAGLVDGSSDAPKAEKKAIAKTQEPEVNTDDDDCPF